MTIELFIPGRPVAQGRVRFARRGKFTTAYDPEQSANYKNWVKVQLLDAGVQMFAKDVPLHLGLVVHVERPASTKPSKRPQPITKPDLDNYIKILSDACNGFIFEDQQIVSIHARKRYVDDKKDQGVTLTVKEFKE